ncbi:histidinol-phosphate transaminase [Gilvibacter sp.]|uniref:histidinol-phosphate transaminase n=1 Tax=Gilvibacter sp. TaxID=2729997 RepID=UPI003F49FF32
MKIKEVIRPDLLALKPYSSARDEYTGKDGVFLDANENPYGTLNRYPDPYQRALKAELAKLRDIDSNRIFVGNGSDEVIDLCFRLFCRPGFDKALQFSPTYGMYKVSAAINNIELLDCPLTTDFQIDLASALKIIESQQPKLIFICSPNNPTGNLIDKAIIRSLAQATKGLVIVDEAYIDFADSESCIRLLEELDNLIISQTFSKAWGLAAARVGVAYSSEALIGWLNNIKPPYNVSGLNQAAAIEALKDREGFAQRKNAILKEKERLISYFEQLDWVQKVYPTQANFILIKVPQATALYEQLIEQQIITRNRSSVIADSLRITVGTPEENDILINALNNL